MFYGFLADVIVAVHLAYVGTAIFGQVLILIGILAKWQWIRNPYFRVAHLLMIVIVAVEAFFNITCPLTTWENDLRVLAGQTSDHDASFIGRLLDSILFCPAEMQGFLTACYYLFAALVILSFIIAPPRWRRAAPPPPMGEPDGSPA